MDTLSGIGYTVDQSRYMVDIHVQYTGGYVYGERWIHYLWGRLGQRAYMVNIHLQVEMLNLR
jgi:hypothetical protein